MKTFALNSVDFLDTPDHKRFYNEQLFTEVAPKYDLITRLLSFGRDEVWKRDMMAAIPEARPDVCVDLACGTGDLTLQLKRRFSDTQVFGVDLTPGMIELARQREGASALTFEVGDMGNLRFDNESVDIITGGYALRNAPDIDTALGEMARVLRPGGYLALLDFSKSPSAALQWAHYGLLKLWGGLWGAIMHRHADVYGYIAESLKRFPDREDLREQFQRHGLTPVASRRYFGGMLEWIVCRKND
jgi:ubiquinone/menaquinone biosynthesis methyltransferase